MKPGRSCSSSSSARPEQGFSRWRTSPGSWSGRRGGPSRRTHCRGGGVVFGAGKNTALDAVKLRSHPPIAPISIWLLTVVVEAGLEMRTTGDGDEAPARAGGSHEAGSCTTRVCRGAADRWFPGIK
jgi:hypothetical protein